jgi:hypothetical protein
MEALEIVALGAEDQAVGEMVGDPVARRGRAARGAAVVAQGAGSNHQI